MPGGYIVRVETWNVGSSLTGGYRLRMIREYTVNLPMPFSYKLKVDQCPNHVAAASGWLDIDSSSKELMVDDQRQDRP